VIALAELGGSGRHRLPRLTFRASDVADRPGVTCQTVVEQALYGLVPLLLLLSAAFGPEDRSLVRRYLRCWPVACLGVVS